MQKNYLDTVVEDWLVEEMETLGGAAAQTMGGGTSFGTSNAPGQMNNSGGIPHKIASYESPMWKKRKKLMP